MVKIAPVEFRLTFSWLNSLVVAYPILHWSWGSQKTNRFATKNRPFHDPEGISANVFQAFHFSGGFQLGSAVSEKIDLEPTQKGGF